MILRDPSARRRLVWFHALVVLTAINATLSLVIVDMLAAEGELLHEFVARGDTCRSTPAAGPSAAAPLVAPRPEERPVSQARGADAYLPLGADVQPLMSLSLERLRRGHVRVDRSRFGSHDILAADAIHLVTLWAPWCGPCKHLLPELRDLFARRGGDWGGHVRFIPVQVQDLTAPAQAYASFSPLMPPAPVKLADRSQRGDFISVLRDPQRALYTGQLPLTLLLDCNRRVRWAKEGTLAPADLEALERWVDRFAGEIRRRDASCQRRWCGNGRCEAGEQDSCADDCDVAVETRPPPCPSDCLSCDDHGRCLVRRAGPVRCGNNRCEPGESESNCCEDCGCTRPLVCRRNQVRDLECLPPLDPD